MEAAVSTYWETGTKNVFEPVIQYTTLPIVTLAKEAVILFHGKPSHTPVP